MRDRFVPLLLLSITLGSAAQPDGFKHRIPDRFRPMDRMLTLETGAPVSRTEAIEFDLATGVPLARCPRGLWSGDVRYIGHAGGTVDWSGEMFLCFAFGKGTARFPDGSRYEGMVAAYLDGGVDLLNAENVRMVVREGNGRHIRPDGEVVQKVFLRGVATDDVHAPRLAAFLAARDRLSLLASDAKFQQVARERQARIQAEREAAARIERESHERAAAAEAARRRQDEAATQPYGSPPVVGGPVATAAPGRDPARPVTSAVAGGTTAADRCFRLFNQFAADGMKVGRCVGDPQSYGSASAMREKERSCYAEVAAASRSARAEYREVCGKARATEGGVTRK